MADRSAAGCYLSPGLEKWNKQFFGGRRAPFPNMTNNNDGGDDADDDDDDDAMMG